MMLQKLRFQSRVEWEISLDEDCKGYRLPKLLIQPLVEKAIVHGLEPVDHPVHISLIGTHAMVGGEKHFVVVVAD